MNFIIFFLIGVATFVLIIVLDMKDRWKDAHELLPIFVIVFFIGASILATADNDKRLEKKFSETAEVTAVVDRVCAREILMDNGDIIPTSNYTFRIGDTITYRQIKWFDRKVHRISTIRYSHRENKKACI